MRVFHLIIALLCLAPSCLSGNAWAKDTSFDEWLHDFKKDAHSQGIAQATLEDAFSETKAPIERVITLDQKQPENVLTLDEYLKNILTNKRIKDGKKALKDHHALLTKIGRQYGVQPRFIVALWGIETLYGKNTGGFSTIDALATLAYDGRRSDFFRGELINALTILQQEHMEASEMKGSWAGALGQCQFMPSTYLKYAVDANEDGKHDIWDTPDDVFASIANYLKSLEWNKKEGWGRRVTLPEGFDMALADIKTEKTLSDWGKLGVRTASGKPLPKGNQQASLIMVGKDDDAVPYLVYSNYKALLQWNRSRFFATAVGTLADHIGN